MSSLTLEQARAIVDGTLKEGRATGCAPLAVAVLDTGGHLKAFSREDGAGILRPQIAIAKAWGSLGMGFGTRWLLGKDPGFLTALSAVSEGRIVPSPGGVLIRHPDGTLLGAAGVSGDTGERDEVCVVAAIQAAGFLAETG
ncbi:MAG: heme-binding protein [Actinomycetota bacterium]